MNPRLSWWRYSGDVSRWSRSSALLDIVTGRVDGWTMLIGCVTFTLDRAPRWQHFGNITTGTGDHG